jgi:ankyrin repeat protein
MFFNILSILRSAIDKAWDCIFAKSTDTTTEQALGELFSNSDYIERRQFGRLHKIVIGLLGGDLERELELSTSMINDTDSTKRTALTWAAARGDEHAVRTLLKYNAKPNTACIAGNSPLLLAARASRPGAIKPLIEAGAWIDWKNSWQYTALHYAACYRNTNDHLRPLLEAGADVNAKDAYGSSPLAVAVDYGQAESARILLDYGANVESRDYTGYTPLLRCIEWNSHQILRLLLGRQAKYTVRTSRGDTVLHLAANRGDLKTIIILTEAGLRDVDSEAINHKGFTAKDLLSRRFETSVEIRTAIERLLSTVRDANAESGNPALNTELCGEECSTEVFEDAVEQQVK